MITSVSRNEATTYENGWSVDWTTVPMPAYLTAIQRVKAYLVEQINELEIKAATAGGKGTDTAEGYIRHEALSAACDLLDARTADLLEDWAIGEYPVNTVLDWQSKHKPY